MVVPLPGSVSQVGSSFTFTPGNGGAGVTWTIPTVPAPVDFWRSGAGGTTLPDGATDFTDTIRRDGAVGLFGDPFSTHDVLGSIGAAQSSSSAAAVAVGSFDYVVTLALAGAQTVTLPAASSAPRRVYVLRNPTATPKTVSSYLDLRGAAVTTIPPFSALAVQSNSAAWVALWVSSLPEFVTVVTASTTITAATQRVIVNNAAVAITLTLPNPLTVPGKTITISRGAPSTGSITVQSAGGAQVQALAGTLGATTTIAAHSGAGAGVSNHFVAAAGAWYR